MIAATPPPAIVAAAVRPPMRGLIAHAFGGGRYLDDSCRRAGRPGSGRFVCWGSIRARDYDARVRFKVAAHVIARDVCRPRVFEDLTGTACGRWHGRRYRLVIDANEAATLPVKVVRP